MGKQVEVDAMQKALQNPLSILPSTHSRMMHAAGNIARLEREEAHLCQIYQCQRRICSAGLAWNLSMCTAENVNIEIFPAPARRQECLRRHPRILPRIVHAGRTVIDRSASELLSGKVACFMYATSRCPSDRQTGNWCNLVHTTDCSKLS